MISRRLLISSAAAVGAAGFSGSLFAAAPDPVLGKDYIEVRPPLEFPKKPIVVHDFFAYTDRDTSMVNVLYRRDDGGYGLLKHQA